LRRYKNYFTIENILQKKYTKTLNCSKVLPKNLDISYFFRTFVVMKCIFTHIITSLTLVCFLTATNGLSLVEHYCSSQGKSYIFLFTQNPDCEDHKCAEKPEEQTCCTHEHTTDCCQNFNHFAKLVADYFSTTNDVKTEKCPIFYVDYLNTECLVCPNCCSANCCDFERDVGISTHLLIKQVTELLL